MTSIRVEYRKLIVSSKDIQDVLDEYAQAYWRLHTIMEWGQVNVCMILEREVVDGG